MMERQEAPAVIQRGASAQQELCDLAEVALMNLEVIISY